MKRTRMVGQLFAGVALFCVFSPAFSAVFSLGPGSSIDLTGTVSLTVKTSSGALLSQGTGDLADQGPNSRHSNLSGLISANVSASDISFLGGNALTALPSGSWQPSGLPASFGFQVEIALSGLGGNSVKLVGDIRDLTFFLTGTKPLSGPSGNQTFDTTGLELATDGGTMDLQTSRCLAGTCTVVDTQTIPPDSSGPPDTLPAGTGKLALVGNTLTLSVPLFLEAADSASEPITVEGIPLTVDVTADIKLQGNIVASMVPEPSAWAMLCVGLAGIGLMWRRMRVT